ncbi:hypothetical protein JTB14_019996 [Gonioctena quinquepunctata]|nr:hypothetical protein JTB14_019996 [Gonioctena quinquepunctata]
MAYPDDYIDIVAIYTELLELVVVILVTEGGGYLDRNQIHAPVEIQQQDNLRINSETIEQNTNYDADRTKPLSKKNKLNLHGYPAIFRAVRNYFR